MQGCPELAADAGLGKLAAFLCRPVNRTTLDLPITIVPSLIKIRAGSFSIFQRQALLDLSRGGLGATEYARLRGLLIEGLVPARAQEGLRRALLAEAADPLTPLGVAVALRAQAAALIAGTFDESTAELLAARIDRDRLADLRAGVFGRTGGVDTVSAYDGGVVRGLGAIVGGAPFATDADGQLVFDISIALKAAYPFFVGPDGLANTADDLPYVTNNPVAQAAGYALAPPISGTVEDRFDLVQPGPTPIPIYSQTAQTTVPSVSSPGSTKLVEVYGVYSQAYLKYYGCVVGLHGTYNGVTAICTDSLAQDVTEAALQAGCPTIARQFQISKFGVGINADGSCIELNSSASPPAQVQFEVLGLLSDPALRPATSGIEPGDLTDLRLRAFLPLPARPVSPNGTAVFPPVTGGFRRNVDLLTGAPVVSSGGTCRVRVDGSSVPTGPNGVAGDGDDVFPSGVGCLLWGAAGSSGAQPLASPSAVAASHSANETLFHELCTATFDADSGNCPLDSLNDRDSFGFTSNVLGGLGFLAGHLLDGTETIRTPPDPLQQLSQLIGTDVSALQFYSVNPMGAQTQAGQDIGFNLRREQAALLGCGVDFASPCSALQGQSWVSDPAISASIGRNLRGGIDFLNADASVLIQEFAVQKALHSDELVGVANDPNGVPVYLPGMNFSRDGTMVSVPNPPGAVQIETGSYLSLTPADVIGMSPGQRAAYQHGGASKLQADGWIEPMPWAVDPNALATFGAVVFQSDPDDPINGSANVFNHAGGQIYGEYCGRWMTSAGGPSTPFSQTCTALETISANYERLLMSAEIIGQDRTFDPPETLEELSAMLDGDPSNDATGDPTSGPDGIFARNTFVFDKSAMDFQVLVFRNASVAATVVTPTGDPAAFFASYDPSTCAQADICLLQVGSLGAYPLVLAWPIAYAETLLEETNEGGFVPVGTVKINLAKLARDRRFDFAHLLGGETIAVDGQFVAMDRSQREGLLGGSDGNPATARDYDLDSVNDLDADRDGVWDGADDFTSGPVSDDEILCGSGIRGDKMLEEGIQFEPWRADQAPGSPAFDALFPLGLPPRSPVFCRSLNSLLSLVGNAPDTTRQFVWHGALPGGAADSDSDSWADGIDNCPTIANTTQADADGDGVGDACDNCVNEANPRVAADYLALNPWATLTGGQRDDDHDGYGNVCDAKFPGVGGALVSPADLGQLRASSGQSRATDACGTTHNVPCAIFDLDEQSPLIDPGDLTRFRALSGMPPGPKCPTCPLGCTPGASGTCD